MERNDDIASALAKTALGALACDLEMVHGTLNLAGGGEVATEDGGNIFEPALGPGLQGQGGPPVQAPALSP